MYWEEEAEGALYHDSVVLVCAHRADLLTGVSSLHF